MLQHYLAIPQLSKKQSMKFVIIGKIKILQKLLELKPEVVPIRKKGKLPHDTIEESYELEYGKATIEIHSDALNSNDNVLIIDDLIATGGTALAAISLVKRLEASVSGCSFIIDLPVLAGNKKISDLGIEVQTLCEFSGH